VTTVEYQCPDGTGFPVIFDSPDDADKPWGLDFEHAPLAMPPLEVEVGRLGIPGAEAAYADHDFPAPAVFVTPSPRTPSGHMYFSFAPRPDDEMGRMITACVALIEQFGSAYGLWRGDSLPRVEEVMSFLTGAGPDVPIAQLAERHAYAQNHTMLSAFVAYGDLLHLQGICGEFYPGEVEIVVNELAAGRGNPTVHIHDELWEVGAVARASSAVMAALHSADPSAAVGELRTAGVEQEFFAALDGFLAKHGLRSEGWLLCQATWAEQGGGLFAALRHVTDPGARPPREVLSSATQRREQLAAEVRSKLPDDKVQAFDDGVERLAHYTAVREERAHWQLVLTGAFRHALLRRGDALAAAGHLERADDVLFLLTNEIEQIGENLAATAADRRAEYERWLEIAPPPRLGPPEDGSAGTDAGPSRTAVPEGQLAAGRGVSRGTATGRARVVRALADADGFEAGDVLVCVTTSPPWTPLFSLASAVVADSGDIGSHTAIAAREYGIPCVLGTNTGTTTIVEGTTVVVDGLAGTVRSAD
jgi:phosphohistidine swiveling domain-containing protein